MIDAILSAALTAKRKAGLSVVLVTGCFDILHRGHVMLLEEAESVGDYVLIGINSDRAVRELKGPGRPVHDQEHRAYLLNALEYVDDVFIIDDARVANAIRMVKPDIWVKGGDYALDTLDKEEVAAAKEVGTRIVIVPRFGDYSTSSILERLKT